MLDQVIREAQRRPNLIPYSTGYVDSWIGCLPYELPHGEPDEALWCDHYTGLPIFIWRDKQLGFLSAAVGIEDFPIWKLRHCEFLGQERTVTYHATHREFANPLVEAYCSVERYHWFTFSCDRPGDRVPAQEQLMLDEQPPYRNFDYVKSRAVALAKELVLIKRG